jgi:hypothetical protein
VKRFKVIALSFCSALFVLVALPAHSLSALLPQTQPSQTGFLSLLLGMHPLAAIAWAIVAARNLIVTVVPEPISMLILGLSLVGLGSLLRPVSQQRVSR